MICLVFFLFILFLSGTYLRRRGKYCFTAGHALYYLYMNRISTFILCGIVGGIFFGAASFVYAAEPQFLISWKPSVYAPNWYEGKLFPTKDSALQVSFELIDQSSTSKGKIISIKDREVRWYIGSDLVRKGNGLQSIIIKNSLFAGSTIDLRIAVDFYDPDTGSQYFTEKYFSIPVVDRKLVLARRSMNNTFSPRSQATWYALPFFFSSDPRTLNLTWTVNGQAVNSVSDSPFSLSIQSGDAGQAVDIQASLEDTNSPWNNSSVFERVYVQ